MADDQDNAASVYKIALTGDGVSIERELDPDVAMEVIALVVGGAGAGGGSSSGGGASRRRPRTRKKAGKSPDGKAKRRKATLGVVKDLSMRPSGKKPFVDFVGEKKPSNHYEKQVVAVYWLTKSAGMKDGITADHVNTCYVTAKWKRPANLAKNLPLTATRKGWLDTSDSDDIKLTVSGEDLVDHELPATKDQ